jgi:phosphatidylserine/phosphatidylglycerophosphate/cardiolipin synthase-like enzyme
MSCGNSRRPRCRVVLGLVAALVAVWTLPVGAAVAATPHLAAVARVLRERSPGTEGKVWWLRHGNVLPSPSATSPGWLLQSVDCWGKPSCGSEPPPGGKSFLQKTEEMIAVARKSVDIAHLIQFKFGNAGYPDGAFLTAIVDGLKRGHREHPHDIPVVRLLVGVHPPAFANEGAFVDQLTKHVGSWVKVQSGGMKTTALSWNHGKVVDVDGREAIVGGENYWASDYLHTNHPTNDISMWVKGPAAADVSRYMDVLWKWTCEHRFIPLNGVAVRFHNIPGFPTADCVKDIAIDPAPPDPHGVWVMTVGKLGHGIDVPGEAGKQSAPIHRPKLSGNTCNKDQASNDNKDVNNKRDYEYRNPGETALRTLIASAHQSIFISQQDLLSCLPKPFAATEAKFDERVFAALAQKVVSRVPIKIVLSNYSTETGGYSNGWHLADVAHVFMQMLQKNDGLSEAAAREKLCKDVGLTTIRNDADVAKWKDGTPFYNHAKLLAVDDEAFYIGSGNLYPSGLQELGFIVEDHTAGAQLKKAYLDPIWKNSSPAALIDPGRGRCDAFPG